MLGKIRTLFWIGVVTLFVPYIGITSGMRTGLTIAIGALVIWLSLHLRKSYKELRYHMRRLEEGVSTPKVDSHTDS